MAVHWRLESQVSSHHAVSHHKPVKFAGLNWEIGMLLTDVLQTILKEGYGCQVDTIPGNSITMESALSSNDIQVLA